MGTLSPKSLVASWLLSLLDSHSGGSQLPRREGMKRPTGGWAEATCQQPREWARRWIFPPQLSPQRTSALADTLKATSWQTLRQNHTSKWPFKSLTHRKRAITNTVVLSHWSFEIFSYAAIDNSYGMWHFISLNKTALLIERFIYWKDGHWLQSLWFHGTV